MCRRHKSCACICCHNTQDDGKHDSDAPNDVVQEAIRNDELRRLEQAERSAAEYLILLAAKIVAPESYTNYEDGYNWCIEQVRSLSDVIIIDYTCTYS